MTTETEPAVMTALRGQAPTTDDATATETRRMFFPSERYVIDFSPMLRNGWEQYDTDQDAHYFGVWVNVQAREVLTYAEGGWSLETVTDAETLRALLARMAEFYGAPPPAFVVIHEDGTRTDHYDTRPTGGDDEGRP